MSYIDPDPDLDAYRRRLRQDPDAVEVDGGFEIRQKYLVSFFPEPCTEQGRRGGYVFSVNYIPETEQDPKS